MSTSISMQRAVPRILAFASAACAFAPSLAHAQQTGQQSQQPASTEQRLAEVEAQNRELERRIDLLAEEVQGFSLSEIITPLGPGRAGLGPAASKVYGIEHGVSLGGYGEFLYQNVESDAGDDTIDALRAVLYVGYRFDERWLLNSEIEFEHGGEETGVEFAYLDYLASDVFNVRAGLLLIPMG